jgi:galactitol-specific phosphotransferase system IIB component
MKSLKGYLTEMASFSPKNFPSDVGNNKDFPGAGERTTYAPTVLNNYKFKEGFPAAKATSIYNDKGEVVKSVKEGEKIYFTLPATLHRSTEFGISRRTTLAPVSLKGFDQKPDGYITISAVAKPAGNSQGRVGAGSATQDMVAQKVKDICFEKGIEVETEFKTARAGSTIPDLVMTIAKTRVQFEIKGTNNRTAPITFFDKSIKRTGRKPDIIEDIADVYINNLKVREGKVADLMRKGKFEKSFIGIIDFFKSRNFTIGLAGDTGVVKSGRLPNEFSISDRAIMKKMRKEILDHFKEGGDDYFVVHNRSSDEFEVYYVGGGKAKNILKTPELPEFKSFTLATYGGASGGATRVGLKIKI